MGLGFGPGSQFGNGASGTGPNGQFASPLDWELYSSTQAHLKNDLAGGALNTPGFRGGASLFGGGKTL